MTHPLPIPGVASHFANGQRVELAGVADKPSTLSLGYGWLRPGRVGNDTLTMLRLTLLTAALVATLMWGHRLVFPAADALPPIALCALLAGVAAFYRFVRPATNFVLCLKALIALVAFSTVYAMLMYCLATTARPWADQTLASLEGALGLSAASVVEWTNARPPLASVMRLIYFSVIPQTMLAIVWLGLSNQRRALDAFLVRFMLAALISAVGFYWLPAKGTCEAYGLAVPAHYAPILEHLDALRSGTRTVITWRGAEGIITFPSFHTVWAVLLTAAFWRRGWIFYPIAALNLLMIVSTVTTGMHYFADVLAGLVVCAVVIAAIREPAVALD
jgi:membrane-associated phospholipid phosphatase